MIKKNGGVTFSRIKSGQLQVNEKIRVEVGVEV